MLPAACPGRGHGECRSGGALVLADEPSQFGLVVQFGDGHVETRCLDLGVDAISGADLLARSGLDVVVNAGSGMGVTVCQIEGEGCAFPADACFCRCMGGGECAYWNYFYREPGKDGWVYSALGAGMRKVRPGSVEAWVWGDGHTPPAEDWTFEAICLPPTPTATETTQPPEAEPVLGEPSETQIPATVAAVPTGVQPQAQETHTQPTATRALPTTPDAGTGSAAPALSSYLPFGLMVLGLVLVGAIVWFRRA